MAKGKRYGMELERRMPAREPTVASDVAVPALQAVFSAFLVAVIVGLAWVIWDFPEPKVAMFISGGLTLILWWFLGLALSRSTMWTVERIIGDDEEPEPLTPSLRVEIAEDDNHWRVGRMPIPDGIDLVARGVLRGRPLSEKEWTGSGKPLSQRQFRAIRDEMMECGLARWKNPGEPRQGAELTPAGRAVMRKLAQGKAPALSGPDDVLRRGAG